MITPMTHDVMDRPIRDGKAYWDIQFRLSQRNSVKFMEALTRVGGYFTDSFQMTTYYGRAESYLFRVWIPIGRESEFESIMGVKLDTPPYKNGA